MACCDGQSNATLESRTSLIHVSWIVPIEIEKTRSMNHHEVHLTGINSSFIS